MCSTGFIVHILMVRGTFTYILLYNVYNYREIESGKRWTKYLNYLGTFLFLFNVSIFSVTKARFCNILPSSYDISWVVSRKRASMKYVVTYLRAYCLWYLNNFLIVFSKSEIRRSCVSISSSRDFHGMFGWTRNSVIVEKLKCRRHLWSVAFLLVARQSRQCVRGAFWQ